MRVATQKDNSGKLLALDIDGTLAAGLSATPDGPVLDKHLHALIREGWSILSASANDAVQQWLFWHARGVPVVGIAWKSAPILSAYRAVLGSVAAYYVGDDAADEHAATAAGYIYMTPQAFLKDYPEILRTEGIVGR